MSDPHHIPQQQNQYFHHRIKYVFGPMLQIPIQDILAVIPITSIHVVDPDRHYKHMKQQYRSHGTIIIIITIRVKNGLRLLHNSYGIFSKYKIISLGFYDCITCLFFTTNPNEESVIILTYQYLFFIMLIKIHKNINICTYVNLPEYYVQFDRACFNTGDILYTSVPRVVYCSLVENVKFKSFLQTFCEARMM